MQVSLEKGLSITVRCKLVTNFG